MPDQDYEITLSNIEGNGATVSSYDPITNTNKKLSVTNSMSNTITVKVPTSDYPRFLVIQEASAKPLFNNVQLNKTKAGPVLSFTPTSTGNVKVLWGKYPIRETGSLTVRRYNDYDSDFTTPVSSASVNGFYFTNSLGKPG